MKLLPSLRLRKFRYRIKNNLIRTKKSNFINNILVMSKKRLISWMIRKNHLSHKITLNLNKITPKFNKVAQKIVMITQTLIERMELMIIILKIKIFNLNNKTPITRTHLKMIKENRTMKKIKIKKSWTIAMIKHKIIDRIWVRANCRWIIIRKSQRIVKIRILRKVWRKVRKHRNFQIRSITALKLWGAQWKM